MEAETTYREEQSECMQAEESEDTEGEEKDQPRIIYNIVFVTSEAAPYSKTGGLGDVCGSLPIALAARGHRVIVVSPMYQRGTSEDSIYSGAVELDHRSKIHCFGGVHEVGFFHEYRKGVDWVRPSKLFSVMLVKMKTTNFISL